MFVLIFEREVLNILDRLKIEGDRHQKGIAALEVGSVKIYD